MTYRFDKDDLDDEIKQEIDQVFHESDFLESPEDFRYGKSFTLEEAEAAEAKAAKQSKKLIEEFRIENEIHSKLAGIIKPEIKYKLIEENKAKVIIKDVLLPITVGKIPNTSRYTVSDILGRFQMEVVEPRSEVIKKVIRLLERYNLVDGESINYEDLKQKPWEDDSAYYKDYNEYYLATWEKRIRKRQKLKQVDAEAEQD
jgi:hypothetical protein